MSDRAVPVDTTAGFGYHFALCACGHTWIRHDHRSPAQPCTAEGCGCRCAEWLEDIEAEEEA